MVGSTDFVPFATGGGANVQSQADYVAASTTQTGFQAGIAPSMLLNKVWRQSSFVASGLTQFLADQLSEHIADDGSLGNLIDQIQRGFLAYIESVSKVRLFSDADYYVNPSTGSDVTGDGSSGLPWATLQYAYDWIQQHVDGAGFGITLHCSDGTYTIGLLTKAPVTGGVITILGNEGAPANCNVIASNASAFVASRGTIMEVRGFKVTATGADAESKGFGIYSDLYSNIRYANIEFGACTSAHVYAAGIAIQDGPVTISGGAPYHVKCLDGTFYAVSQLVTITGNPAFSSEFLVSFHGHITYQAMAITGAATGAQWLASVNGVIEVQGTTVPGNVAGATNTGGQVVT